MLSKSYNTYEDLIRLIKESGKDFELNLIEDAYQYAIKAHKNQVRASGEPYIVHPVSVACILVELGMDTESIVAAMLHDVVEDTEITLEDVQKQYGETISCLIDGLTKIEKMNFSSREERQAENIRKMLIAMNKDIRVIIIKLADRLNNMRTLSALGEEKQRIIAHETIEIFAPIAHRLGIRPIKEELEDTSLQYLDPIGYQEIVDELNKKNPVRKGFIKRIIEEIRTELGEKYVDAEFSGRIKSIYGIYNKMFKQQCTFDEIFDVYAVRIIVDDIESCYHVLGVIHQMFVPIPKRIKDYITMPKPNGYQSLHTTVFSRKDKIPFEVQIRTKEMHQMAEYGVAAHWKYKLGFGGKDRMDKKLEWIIALLENQKEAGDAVELISQIKNDIMPEEVYVFTPKGDCKELPLGSTVIDFAYAIHTAVGNRMVGAKVNSRIVPITYEVNTGDIVEIITTKDPAHGPSRDWLKIVKTSEARSKIRSWFKHERREENIEEGCSALTRELRRNSILINNELTSAIIVETAGKYKFVTADDFYAAIGYGGVMLSRVVPRIVDEYHRRRQPEEPVIELNAKAAEKASKTADGVIVNGVENVLVKFSKCCNPVPGDDIVGFVTRGYGVSIHKRDCANVPRDVRMSPEPERWVKAEWGDKELKNRYKATIELVAGDREGLLFDVSRLFSDMHLSIITLNSRRLKDSRASIMVTFLTNGREHVDSVIARVQKIKGVHSVERTCG